MVYCKTISNTHSSTYSTCDLLWWRGRQAMTIMKEKVATRMAAHDRMKNKWVLSAGNTHKTCYRARTVYGEMHHVNEPVWLSSWSRDTRLSGAQLKLFIYLSASKEWALKVVYFQPQWDHDIKWITALANQLSTVDMWGPVRSLLAELLGFSAFRCSLYVCGTN